MRKKFEKKGKNILISFLRFLLRNRPVQGKADLSSIKKILVVRQDDRIGNLILTTPLLSALRVNFPQAEISFLASRVFAELFSDSKLVDELLVLEKKRYIRNPLAFIQNIVKLRKKKFDLAFDCSDENHLSFGHGMWIYLSGAKYRVGHKRDGSDLFLNIEIPPVNYIRHATDMNLDLLRYLIPLNISGLPYLQVRNEEEEHIKDYLGNMRIREEDFLVGINLGGTGDKRWEIENFIELGNKLKEKKGLKVIYIWGPQEKEMVKGLKMPGVLDKILPLPKLSALLKSCDLFISSDSGIMHLSTAVGTPTLAIFIHSDPQKYGPKGEKHRVITSEEGKLKVGEVLEEALKMMGELSNIKEFQMTDKK